MKKTEQWIATYIATIKYYHDLIEELEKDSPLFTDRAEYNKLHAHYTKRYRCLIDEFEEKYSAYMYA